ncbi:MAG: FHA domain-containing protein [bacterium]|nr:FHA domain-containing protein [bacterium]
MDNAKYVMFYMEGFLKKLHLHKPSLYFGRNQQNDLVVDKDTISAKHLHIEVKENCIIITDLDSTNGTHVKGLEIKKAVVNMKESFSICGTEFILDEGSLDEFEPAKELHPYFEHLNKEKAMKKDRKTRYIKNVYKETLKQILHNSLKMGCFNEFLLDLSNYLSDLPDFGSLYIVSPSLPVAGTPCRTEQDCENGFDILLTINAKPRLSNVLNQVVLNEHKIFKKRNSHQPVNGMCFYSYPLIIPGRKAALVYFPKKTIRKEITNVQRFLSGLSHVIILIARVNGNNHKKKNCTEPLPKIPVEIIAENEKMKSLIQQAEKMAVGDLFILVSGDNGTGKELFARLLHHGTKRRSKKLVALNCASIPEHLLEAELFGYEKGAFTGADRQKIGQLELASGGTLLLDEIGDMPLPLQAKLLRAFQEHTFFRLGGLEPISVDLRFISITNKDLHKLMKEDLFREDLYYRLVQRVIEIPPLRERREDIAALINFFTQKFCRQYHKTISGYSKKAFDTLQNYSWPGNVRQLQNEIVSLVNLTTDGDIVNYEAISKEITSEDSPPRTGTALPPQSPITVEKPRISIPFQYPPEASPRDKREIKKILETLEENDWHKTKAAEVLGMTYRGLHKKMKRLGIDKIKG